MSPSTEEVADPQKISLISDLSLNSLNGALGP